MDELIKQIQIREGKKYEDEISELQCLLSNKEKELKTLAYQREMEMKAMLNVIQITQQKILTLHLQFKHHNDTRKYNDMEKSFNSSISKKVYNTDYYILLYCMYCIL